jgi:hypothetical protein
MRYLISSLVGILLTLTTFSQVDSERSYLLATLYLKSSRVLNEEIKETFSYKFGKKDHCVDFKIKGEVWFLPLYFFADQLQANNLGVDTGLIRNREMFKAKNYFEPFKAPSLEKFLPEMNSSIYLSFSKPFGNFLIAEMLDEGFGGTNTVKMGKGIQFLFVFNNEGYIENVIFSRTTYR